MKRILKLPLGLLIAALAATTVFAQAGDEESGASLTADAYYHFARAHLLEADGDWEGALAAYDEALALDPTNSSIYSEIAASYAGRNLWRDAVDYANRATNVDPDNLDAHRLLGGIYTSLVSNSAGQDDSGEYIALAIEELEHVVRLSPEETDAYLTLGRLYRYSGQPERAVELYRDFIQVEPSSEEGAIALAELQMGVGNLGEAIDLLEDFVEGQPESSPAWLLLGQAYVQLDELGSAADAFQTAINLGRDEIELLKELARILFVTEEWDRSAEKYNELVEREPADAVSWLRLGQIEQQRMHFAEARRHMERADQIVPDSPDIGFAMALLARDEGQFGDGIDRLRGLLDSSRQPGNRYTEAERGRRQLFLRHIALLHTMLEQYEDAVAAFEETKALVRERDGTIDSYIVDTYRFAGQPERALEKAESTLEVFPDHRQLRIQRADLLAETGQPEEGIELLADMLEERDSDYEIYSTMVSIHEGAENWTDAEVLLDDMIERFENRRQQSYFLKGAVLERQLRDGDAEDAFRQSLDIDAENPAVLNYLGYMLADNGEKLEEALEMIQKAVDTDPINGAYLDSLGWVYYRLDRLELAEEYLQRAVLFSSTDPTLHEHLGDLYRSMGRLDEALESYERSLELADNPEERATVQEKMEQVR
jgi:tetratricopeptide (TPR) repeat protein